MIKNSFIMLDGVGERTEQQMWRNGILSWDDFLTTQKVLNFSRDRKRLYEESLLFFSHELACLNEIPFAEFVKPRDHWRLFRQFQEHTVCIDIETNGLPVHAGGETTVVGLYDGRDFKQFVKGVDLNETTLAKELSRYKLLVSFFGSSFDVPFLKKEFPSIQFSMPHFDLCFSARRIGLTGGLKRIENLLSIHRDDEINGLDGYDAVILWKDWCNGSQSALNTLMRYNRSDTVNLMELAFYIYDKLIENLGFQRYIT